MIPKRIIEKAIEGGYGQTDAPYSTTWSGMALDPLFWSSLGKALGWAKNGRINGCYIWEYNAKMFYDLILNGGDTDAYWNELLGITK